MQEKFTAKGWNLDFGFVDLEVVECQKLVSALIVMYHLCSL